MTTKGIVVIGLIVLAAFIPLVTVVRSIDTSPSACVLSQETLPVGVGVGNVSPVITNFFIERVKISSTETKFTIRCEIVDNNSHDDLVSTTYKVSLGASPRYHGDLVYDGSDKYHAPPFILGSGDSGNWSVYLEAVDDNGAKGYLLSSFSYQVEVEVGGIPFISPRLREFSIIFMSGVVEPLPQFAVAPFKPKREFTLDETIYLLALIQDTKTEEPVTNADVDIWFGDHIRRIPTLELGRGYYQGFIPADELGLGAFEANVDVQLRRYKEATGYVTFIVAEPPIPIWELPAFWAALFAGFVGLLVAVDIKRRPSASR